MGKQATIRVEETERRPTETVYRVVVEEGDSSTEHVVNLTHADSARLAPAQPGDVLVRAAFEFLLAREPKETIFRAFDLREIKDYFHEFEVQMARKFGSNWRG